MDHRRGLLYASYVLRAVTVIAGAWALVHGGWKLGLGTLLIALLMSVPGLLRSYRVYLPFELEFGSVFFVFLSLFLGHVQDLYNRVPHWDKLVHFQSGITFAVMAFVLAYLLNEHERVRAYLSPSFLAIFAATFAIALGAVWEIGEFAADLAFATTYWQDGLADTMWDLIADSVGAAIVAGTGYAWMRHRARVPFTPTALSARDSTDAPDRGIPEA